MFAIAARHALARLERRARRAIARVEPVLRRERVVLQQRVRRRDRLLLLPAGNGARCPVFVFNDAQIFLGVVFNNEGILPGKNGR